MNSNSGKSRRELHLTANTERLIRMAPRDVLIAAFLESAAVHVSVALGQAAAAGENANDPAQMLEDAVVTFCQRGIATLDRNRAEWEREDRAAQPERAATPEQREAAAREAGDALARAARPDSIPGPGTDTQQ